MSINSTVVLFDPQSKLDENKPIVSWAQGKQDINRERSMKCLLAMIDGTVMFHYIGDMSRDQRIELVFETAGVDASVVDDSDEEYKVPSWYRTVDLVVLRETIDTMFDECVQSDWYRAPLIVDNPSLFQW
jgi:hypothetical protein